MSAPAAATERHVQGGPDSAKLGLRDVVLYHCPLTRSVRPLWLLHELGAEFTVRQVDLMAGAALTPEFLKMNPNHAVPVLTYSLASGGGELCTLIESIAITLFLAETPLGLEKGLAPPLGHPDRATFLQWVAFAGSWMDMMLWQIRLHGDLLRRKERDPRAIERSKEKWVAEVEPQLVEKLAGGPWICGERFTAADCIVAHCVRWSMFYGLSQRPELQAYMDRCKARPAFQAAYADAARL